jgi:FK506-binding protein 2
VFVPAVTMMMIMVLFLLLLQINISLQKETEMDFGDGLRVLSIYKPNDCNYQAMNNDIVHYHYVGKLEKTGVIFGRSFDYDSPYIVGLGQGRIIAGMDRGLVGTCLFERRRITIPPDLGYGQSGVGELIPPNSTLIFYIRLIKLERNGEVLSDYYDINDAWNKGLQEYTIGEHRKSIDIIEISLLMYNKYINESKHCLNKCMQNDSINDIGSLPDDTFLKHVLSYSVTSNCIIQCKQERLSNFVMPKAELLKQYQDLIPYSYLQYSYYQLGLNTEAVKYAFLFYYRHPNDGMITNAIRYYRRHLDDITEPEVEPHHRYYLDSKEAYENGNWLESAEKMELALSLYQESLKDCLTLCEDIIHVNLTLTESKARKLDENHLFLDSHDYYNLLRSIIIPQLRCRINCRDALATIRGKHVQKYLASHFDYLQFNYFKLKDFSKAVKAAATFFALEPSDPKMAGNLKYYRQNYNVTDEDFNPREEIVSSQKYLETEKRLVNFAMTGNFQKRTGVIGDRGLLHEEL